MSSDNKQSMGSAFAIFSRIVNAILMAVLFYGIFTPAALILRLFRKDPLRLTRDPSAGTYWIPRQHPPEAMTRQF